MAEATQSQELREAIEEHLEQTVEHAHRIEQAFETLGEKLTNKKCKATEGLVAEAKELMQEFKDDPALDAVLISTAQKVEHYEIASYGTLCAWAKQMGHDEVVELLQETLDEEKAADERLTEVAEGLANTDSENETESEDEEK